MLENNYMDTQWRDGILCEWTGETQIKYSIDQVSLRTEKNIICYSNQITGIGTYFKPESKWSEVVIETDDGYRKLKIQHQDLHLFSISHQPFKNREKMLSSGLPAWCHRIPGITNDWRRFIQTLIVTIEVGIFLWTMYQLTYDAPGFWWLMEKTVIPLVGPIVTGGARYIISVASKIEGLRVVTELRTLLWSMSAFVRTIGSSIVPIWEMIKLILLPIWFVMSYGWSCIRFVISLLFPSSNTGGSTINLLSVWNYIAKPVRYLYVLIMAPHTGELGRGIKTLKKNEMGENDEKED